MDINLHINLEKKYFIVERTLAKDRNGKIILGSSTKTGKRKMKQSIVDKTIVPFGVFEEESVITILLEQIKIAKSNPNNKENLLFYRLDGSYINHAQVNQIFKRICREAKIKLQLVPECNFHMTRHTFVTCCIEARMELITIAKLVGHSSTRPIEKTYGHILAQFMNEELEGLRDYYARKKIILLRDCYKRIENIA